MKRILLLLLTCGWGTSFCSSIASADGETSERRDKEGRTIFRFGLSGGETKRFVDGVPESSSTPIGIGEFRLGYEFPTAVSLDLGVQGLALGADQERVVSDGPTGGKGPPHRISASAANGVLYSLRVGYRLDRFRTYGGFGLGNLKENRQILGDPDSGSYAVRSDLAGPVFGLGFVLLQGKSAELELAGDLTYLSLNPRQSIGQRATETDDDRKASKVLTHSLGIKFNLFTSQTRRERSGASSNSVSLYCHAGCFRGTGDLLSLAPKLGLEITKLLIQIVLRGR